MGSRRAHWPCMTWRSESRRSKTLLHSSPPLTTLTTREQLANLTEENHLDLYIQETQEILVVVDFLMMMMTQVRLRAVLGGMADCSWKAWRTCDRCGKTAVPPSRNS